MAHLPHLVTFKQLPSWVGVSTLKRKNFESLGPILELAKFTGLGYHISASHTAKKSVVGIGPKTKEQSDALEKH